MYKGTGPVEEGWGSRGDAKWIAWFMLLKETFKNNSFIFIIFIILRVVDKLSELLGNYQNSIIEKTKNAEQR